MPQILKEIVELTQWNHLGEHSFPNLQGARGLYLQHKRPKYHVLVEGSMSLLSCPQCVHRVKRTYNTTAHRLKVKESADLFMAPRGLHPHHKCPESLVQVAGD